MVTRTLVLQIYLGDTSASEGSLEHRSATPSKTSSSRRRRGPNGSTMAAAADFAVVANNNNNNNANAANNNHVKNERLSPGTPDTSSRSRSVTPSSASHPDTPPAPEANPLLGRNYSDFMRSLAAKYNNASPNDYFTSTRNGFHPSPLDARFKTSPFPPLIATLPQAQQQPPPTPTAKEPSSTAAPPAADAAPKKSSAADAAAVLNPFGGLAVFPHFIDMSATQALAAMARVAKDAEVHELLKGAAAAAATSAPRRADPASPLDLSAQPAPAKRPRLRVAAPAPSSSTSAMSSGVPGGVGKAASEGSAESPAATASAEEVATWGVEDVYGFVAGIDICAEYAQNFKEQRIDGAGLPLLTEEHLTTTMGMKLGPALKLKSILAKKLGSCSVCLHCTHFHVQESALPTGSSSDSSAN